MIDASAAYDLVYKALDYRSLRQDLIASNIANVDTPFYKPRDVSFEDVLAQKSSDLFSNAPKMRLSLAYTNKNHLEAFDIDAKNSQIFIRDGHLARNDGNSVDLDVETSELGKNQVMYQALTSALRRHKSIFTYAIESSRNI
ncbi:MAG: flagellar basal body rod protein FlgB [Helicobacter sp.]|nr:flagellar basal body rod protein FlgB [Helicobacter sp.]